jgi:hypothetical protein
MGAETQEAVMEVTKNQEKLWKWERAGWIFMGVALLSGLVEILTPTPLIEAVAHTMGRRPGNSEAKEKGSAARLEVQVGPEATSGEELILQVASKHFQNLEVQSIVPAPSKVITAGDTYEYVFAVQKPNEGLAIQFYLRSRHGGQKQNEMHFSTPGALAFSRFVAP